MDLDDLEQWARGAGLECVLLILGALLLARLVRWAAAVASRRAEVTARARVGEGALLDDQDRQRLALAQSVPWAIIALLWTITVLMVLERLNVPTSTFVGPAAVTGVALGFGAQRVVQDILGGFFIVAERQYGIGDLIRVAPPGERGGIAGTVESITLRSTRLRTLEGELVILPNGEIRQVTNLSKDWARVVIDIPLAPDADLDLARTVLHDVSEAMITDEHWAPMLLDRPTVMGVESISVGFVQLRYVARTLPSKQWDVARELRGRVATALGEAGVRTAMPVGMGTQAPPAARA